MLSGFRGLIAIETSAGLMADGSVIRTTCWARVNGALSKTTHARVARHVFIQDCRINKIYTICLQLFHKEGTEFVKDVDCGRSVFPDLGAHVEDIYG